jgi:hypothetical protein
MSVGWGLAFVGLVSSVFVGCGPGAATPPGGPAPATEVPVGRSVEIGSATVMGNSVVASFEVQEPLHCAGASDWPPLCVVVSSSSARGGSQAASLTARLEYRPEVTFLDAEEVWVRVYDGKLQSGAAPSPDLPGVSGLARMTLSNPLGLASISQARETGILSISLSGLNDVAPGTTLLVRLVDRLAP